MLPTNLALTVMGCRVVREATVLGEIALEMYERGSRLEVRAAGTAGANDGLNKRTCPNFLHSTANLVVPSLQPSRCQRYPPSG